MTNLPQTPSLELDLTDGWLTIWLNQPEKRNAFTDELRTDLLATLASVRDDRAVRGITLRGRGGVFCAGGDLKQFQTDFQTTASIDDIKEMSRETAAMLDALNTAPQVVIVLIEGAAMAGGFGLACCADVVISEETARFAMTETMIGLSPAQIAPFAIQKLGYATARRLMLTGSRFNGAEAHTLGFADFIGADAAALEAIESQLKTNILKCAPGAVADTKALLVALPDLSRAETIEAAAANFAGRMKSDEAKEGVASFFEKRPATWAAQKARASEAKS